MRVRRRRTSLALTVVLGAAAMAVALGHQKARTTTAVSASHTLPSGQLDAAVFAPGACVAMAPTGADRRQTVLLDAGHGGPDPGASGTTSDGRSVDERDLTLPVVVDAASTLRAAGYRVVVSRIVDTAVARLVPADLTATGALSLQGEHDDIEARVACANLSGAGVLVSVHFDAFSDPTARGLTTTYDDSRPFAAVNQQLAELVDANVLAALHTAGWQVPDRGVVPDTTLGAPALSQEAHDYGHLLLLGPAAPGWLDHPTTMPGVLVEPLFLTDPAEASVADDPAGQRAIATGIVNAVESFLPGGPPATHSR